MNLNNKGAQGKKNILFVLQSSVHEVDGQFMITVSVSVPPALATEQVVAFLVITALGSQILV